MESYFVSVIVDNSGPFLGILSVLGTFSVTISLKTPSSRFVVPFVHNRLYIFTPLPILADPFDFLSFSLWQLQLTFQLRHFKQI